MHSTAGDDLVSTDQAAISDLSALLEKSTSQYTSTNTDTTVDWDSQTLDCDLFGYDTSTDNLTVLATSGNVVKGQVEVKNGAD